MKIDLDKTMGYDVGQRSGKSVCRKTLVKTTKSRDLDILSDMAQFINEAGFNGATVKEQLPIARLMGYCQQIATAITLAEACGVQFITTTKADGTESLSARINFKTIKE